MTGKFRIARGWRIFVWIMVPMLAALFGWLTGVLLLAANANWIVTAFMLPLCLGMLTLCGYGIADLIMGYLLIDERSISLKDPLGTKRLEFSEIKGYRTNQQYIFVVPKEPGKKQIKISNYTAQYSLISEWIAERFVDLDVAEAAEEEKRILSNEEFGSTHQARELRLLEARKVARVINIAGYGVGIWVLFFPRPYDLSVLSAIALPVVALLATWWYRGLIRFDTSDNSAYPGLTYAIAIPALAIAARSILDFELLAYRNAFISTAMMTSALTLVMWLATTEFNLKTTKSRFGLAAFILFLLAHSYGSVIMINCNFDRSEPQVFSTVVLDKEISSGKSTTYYLKLDTWGPRSEPEKVSVSESSFESVDTGDTVDVHVHSGLLNTPWFYVAVE